MLAGSSCKGEIPHEIIKCFSITKSNPRLDSSLPGNHLIALYFILVIDSIIFSLET